MDICGRLIGLHSRFCCDIDIAKWWTHIWSGKNIYRKRLCVMIVFHSFSQLWKRFVFEKNGRKCNDQSILFIIAEIKCQITISHTQFIWFLVSFYFLRKRFAIRIAWLFFSKFKNNTISRNYEMQSNQIYTSVNFVANIIVNMIHWICKVFRRCLQCKHQHSRISCYKHHKKIEK